MSSNKIKLLKIAWSKRNVEMMAARGMPVTYLKRIAEGGLTLGGLEKGAVVELDVV